MDWETLLRYGAGQRVLYTQDAAFKVWARRELDEGMKWLAEEFRLEACEQMRADDEGMALSPGHDSSGSPWPAARRH